jgi:hypothetical protein
MVMVRSLVSDRSLTIIRQTRCEVKGVCCGVRDQRPVLAGGGLAPRFLGSSRIPRLENRETWGTPALVLLVRRYSDTLARLDELAAR